MRPWRHSELLNTHSMAEPNPLDNGAKGDGSSDDWGVINGLLTKWHALFLPAGYTFHCSQRINLTATYSIRGVGWDQSILSFAAGVSGIWLSNGDNCGRLQGFRIKSESTGTGTDNGLLFNGASEQTIDSVLVTGFGQDGVSFDSGNESDNNLLINVNSKANWRHAFNVHNTGSFCIANVFLRPQAFQVGLHGGAGPCHGFVVSNYRNIFYAPHVEGRSAAGDDIRIDGSGNLFDGPYLETNFGGVANSVHFVSGSAYNEVRFNSGPFAVPTPIFDDFVTKLNNIIEYNQMHHRAKGYELIETYATDAPGGTATLGASGTVTINTTQITANSHVICTGRSAQGALRVSARVAGTSFTVTSSLGVGDSGGTFDWFIMEPVLFP